MVFVAVWGPRIVGARATRGPQEQEAAGNAEGGAIGLIAVWSGLFIYIAFKFMKGQVPAQRAIPAGAFLLAFLAVIAWLLIRDRKLRRAADESAAPIETPR